MSSIVSLWQRLDHWLLHRPWAPTIEGMLWFLLSTLIMVQGLVRGFNLVSFIATFLLSMWLVNMLVTLFSGKRLRELRVRRKVMGSVHVGQPVYVGLEVENIGMTVVNGLRLTDMGIAHSNTIGLSELEPRQRAETRKQFTPLERGLYRWQPVLVSTAYPFGLYRRTVHGTVDDQKTIILPKLGQLDVQQFQRWLKQSRRASSLLTRMRAKRSMAPADFYGIREYRPGDSARWIHWRTTARIGRPMVREFEEPPQTHITLLLEACLPDTEENLRKAWQAALLSLKQTIRFYESTNTAVDAVRVAELRQKELQSSQPLHAIEQGISLASTICHTWARRLGSTITLGVLDGSSDLPTVLESGQNLRHLTPMLERLAQVKAVPEPPAKQLLHEMGRVCIPDGPILLISTTQSNLSMSLTNTLGRPVQLLDLSKSQAVRRFFSTDVMAAPPGR